MCDYSPIRKLTLYFLTCKTTLPRIQILVDIDGPHGDVVPRNGSGSFLVHNGLEGIQLRVGIYLKKSKGHKLATCHFNKK